jgi:hypothetical protein
VDFVVVAGDLADGDLAGAGTRLVLLDVLVAEVERTALGEAGGADAPVGVDGTEGGAAARLRTAREGGQQAEDERAGEILRARKVEAACRQAPWIGCTVSPDAKRIDAPRLRGGMTKTRVRREGAGRAPAGRVGAHARGSGPRCGGGIGGDFAGLRGRELRGRRGGPVRAQRAVRQRARGVPGVTLTATSATSAASPADSSAAWPWWPSWSTCVPALAATTCASPVPSAGGTRVVAIATNHSNSQTARRRPKRRELRSPCMLRRSSTAEYAPVGARLSDELLGIDECQPGGWRRRNAFPRMVGMHRRSLLAALAAMGLAPAWAFHALPEKFDPARDAAADLEQALVLAQAQRKLVFVDVGGEWCSWCHIFDRFVAAHPEVRNALAERYIVLR